MNNIKITPAFTGTINIAPCNWQTTLKNKPRMLEAMEGFDKFVKEELPDDVKVTVNLFKYDAGKGITGGSDAIFDLDSVTDEELEELLGQEPATLPIKGNTPLKDINVAIKARSEKQGVGFDGIISGEDLKPWAKGAKKGLLRAFQQHY